MVKISKTKHITKKGTIKKNPKKLPSSEEFGAFVQVQYGGRYNMYDANARLLSGLDRETYTKVMENYDELATKYPAVIKRMEIMRNM